MNAARSRNYVIRQNDIDTIRRYRGHHGRAAFRLHNYPPVYKSYIKRKTGQPSRRGIEPDAPEPLLVEPLQAVPDAEFVPGVPEAGSDVESEGPEFEDLDRADRGGEASTSEPASRFYRVVISDSDEDEDMSQRGKPVFEDLDSVAFGDDQGPATTAPTSTVGTETRSSQPARQSRSRASTATSDAPPAQRQKTCTAAAAESTVVTTVPVSATSTLPTDALAPPSWAPNFKYDGSKVVSVKDRVLSSGVAFAISKATALPEDMVKHKEMTNSRLAVTTLQSELSVSASAEFISLSIPLYHIPNRFLPRFRPSRRPWS